MYCIPIFLFRGRYYPCIRWSFTFQKESFRKNIKTNHDNWWWDQRWKTAAAEISALSWSKDDKYEYFTVEVMLPSDQSKMIEQAKFTYSPLGKAFKSK